MAKFHNAEPGMALQRKNDLPKLVEVENVYWKFNRISIVKIIVS